MLEQFSNQSNQVRQLKSNMVTLISRIPGPKQQFNLISSQQCKPHMSCDASSSTGGGVRGCGCSGVLGAGLRRITDCHN